MPTTSKISNLPSAIRTQLDRRLAAASYGQLEECASWLATKGHPIGKSAIGVYARGLKEKARLLATPKQILAARLACLQIAASTGPQRTVLMRARRYLAWIADTGPI